MNTELYNGWINRETWALNLWLTNEESIYNEVVSILKEAHKKDLKENTETIYKEDALKDFVEELLTEDNIKTNHNLYLMLIDIGSLWRVNYKDVVMAFSEDF